MRFIYIDKQELKKDTQIHYKTVEEFLLTEFPKGFQAGTQVALYREKEDKSRFILTKETFEDDLKLELKDMDTLVVIVNPEGGAVKQTLIGVAMIVVGSETFGIGSALLVQAGVGVALGGVSQMLMDKPEIPQPVQMKDTPKADEVFSANFSQIKPKLGEMIPVGYGVFRKSPDLLSEYVEYKKNKEIHHLVTCLGYGEYNINKAFLGETDINTTNLNGIFKKDYNIEIPDSNQLLIEEYVWDVLNNTGEIEINIKYWYFKGTITVYYNFSGDENERIGEVVLDVADDTAGGYIKLKANIDNPQATLYVYGEVTNVTSDDDIHEIESISYKEKDIAIKYNKFYNQKLETYIPKRILQKDNVELNKFEMDWVYLGDDNLDEVLLTLICPNGMYHQNNDGSLSSISRDLTIFFKFEKDDGTFQETTQQLTVSPTPCLPTYSPINTPILMSVRFGNLGGDISNTISCEFDIASCTNTFENNYDILNYLDGSRRKRWVKVVATPPSDNNRDIDKLFLKTIYGMKKYTYNTSNKTLLTFDVTITNAISKSSSKNIIVEAERLDKQNDIKSVITDIFTNGTYGGKLPQEMLNLPDTPETFNHCFTANQTIKEAIEKVAISGMYMLKPNQGISLHKIQSQPLQYFLDASRIKDLKVESITKNEFMKDGYRVFYRDSEYKEQYVTYPTNASYPNELHLAGCSNEQIASDYAYYLYQSERKANIRYRFSVELEGNTIPLYSRIKIGFNHIKTGFSSTVNNVIDDTSFYSTDYVMFEPVKDLDPVLETVTHTFQAGEASIIFHNDNLEASETLEISEISRSPKSGWKIITTEPLPNYLKNGTPYHLGYTQKFIKDTVVKEKVWNGNGWDMMCEAYSEEVFQ